MKKTQLLATSFLAAMVAGGSAWAKLPAPSDEAKAKAAEAAAKTAHAGKVAGFQLCKSQDRTAQAYLASAKKAGKTTAAPVATPPCADTGAFVYVPAAPATPAAVAAAPAAPVAPKK